MRAIGVIIFIVLAFWGIGNFSSSIQTSYAISQAGKDDWSMEGARGRMAPSVCRPDDDQANYREGNTWCRDYMQLVEGSVQFDPRARERWRDAYYHQFCPNSLRHQSLREEQAWCEPYYRLLPEFPDYIGHANRERWLMEDGRHRHACHGRGGNFAGCPGFLQRSSRHSWRSEPQG